jgi:hypothetical protein
LELSLVGVSASIPRAVRGRKDGSFGAVPSAHAAAGTSPPRRMPHVPEIGQNDKKSEPRDVRFRTDALMRAYKR